MRCPDCGHDVPIKPEVVLQREPCKCGLTEFARTFRMGSIVVLFVVLSLFGGCLTEMYWTTKQVEMMKDHYEIRDKKKAYLSPAEKIGPPFDVVPKGK